MKQLKCEMCGSTDLIKEDGVFVCQSCGCKYSVEEAKKMMVEGTVEVTGTVKVDQKENAENYLELAKTAFDANNLEQCEQYCNKIIETDATNSTAWMYKAAAVGWQSSLGNLRIEECVSYYAKAIEYTSDEKLKELTKKQISVEVAQLSLALVAKTCKVYEENPIKRNVEMVLHNIQVLNNVSTLLKESCGVESIDFSKRVAAELHSAAIHAWNLIIETWNGTDRPSQYDAEKCANAALNTLLVYQAAIDFAEDDNDADAKRYAGMATIIKNIYDIHYRGWDSDMHQEIWPFYFRHDEREKLLDRMMEYHRKAKELDPTHEIPERPVYKAPSAAEAALAQTIANGCYVATAVYGSYDCPQVWTLRRYRDNTLAKTWYGRLFIHTYYAISPTLVKWFGETNWFKNMWKPKLDKMVEKLNAEGVEDTPYQDINWR